MVKRETFMSNFNTLQANDGCDEAHSQAQFKADATAEL